MFICFHCLEDASLPASSSPKLSSSLSLSLECHFLKDAFPMPTLTPISIILHFSFLAFFFFFLTAPITLVLTSFVSLLNCKLWEGLLLYYSWNTVGTQHAWWTLPRSLLPPVAVDAILGPRNTNEDPSGRWDNLDLEVPREKHPEASHGQGLKEHKWVRETLYSQGVYNLRTQECMQVAKDSDNKKLLDWKRQVRPGVQGKSWLTLPEHRFSEAARETGPPWPPPRPPCQQNWQPGSGVKSIISLESDRMASWHTSSDIGSKFLKLLTPVFIIIIC